MDLYTLIDSHSYVDTNCYQHQMSEALEGRFNVKYITINDLNFDAVPETAHVLSRLKLRTIYNNLPRLKKALNGRQVMIYEQDPWESFKINDVYSGAYLRIYDTLNVSTFLNISHWWRDRVHDLGIPSEFVQIWTLPRYCRSEPVPWRDRKYDVAFCGTMYPRRKVFFDSLESLGIKVTVLPAGRSYADYLDDIAQARIAIRSERVDWTIDVAGKINTIHHPNALWKRDIETAAQGCFSMREHDDEGVLWNVGAIPIICPFFEAKDAAENIKNILSLEPAFADTMVRQSIDYVRNAPGWSIMCDVIEDIINGKIAINVL